MTGLALEEAPLISRDGEWEFEAEAEFELEGELEAEEFFRRLASLASRAASSPTLRRVGLAAARTALGGLGNIGAAIGGPRGTTGSRVGGGLGAAAGQVLGSFLPDAEFEAELEWEAEANPIRRAYPEALMEHLGHAASTAESEAEAEAFVGALIPLAARLVPRVAPAIMRAAPQLIRGIAGVTRTLRRSPATRPLVRTVPTIVRRTAHSLARQQAQGRPVTVPAATRTLATQTARVLSSPQASVGAYQRSRRLDRRYHRIAGRPAAAIAGAGRCPTCSR